MADNSQAGAAVGIGDVFASDDIGGVKWPRAKLAWGIDGVAVDASATDPIPVVQTGTPALPTGAATETTLANLNTKVPATLGQKSMAASMAVVLPSDQSSIPVSATLTAETTKVIGTVNIAAAQTIAVTNAGTFAAQAAGTKTNNNAAPGATNLGTLPVLANAAAPAWVEGNQTALSADLSGRLRTDNSTVAGTVIATGNGVVSAGVQRVAIASDNTAFPVNATLQASTNTQEVVGDAAQGAAVAGNPLLQGCEARTSDGTPVTNGQVVRAIADTLGKQIVLPYSISENLVSGVISSAMTATTSTSLVAAPGAGLRNYITTIIVSNSHASVGTDVIIQDGSGGATLMVIPAGSVYGGSVISLPNALRQPTANTVLFCANVTTGASTKVSAVGYKAP
jgi:hypothetical protein